MSVTNINKIIDRVGSLFSFAVKNGYMDKNPAEGKRVKQKRKTPDQFCAAYDVDDLNRIFASSAYTQDTFSHPYRFWVPVIGLFTGCRLDEICQLHLEDIRHEDGVWVFNINGEGERKLKTASAKRLIPLHPFLANHLNLPGYAQRLRNEGQSRLFPELQKGRDGYGHAASNWFQRYRKEIGIEGNGRKKDFHSFRHSFTDALKQQMTIPDAMIKQLVGHANEDITMGRYGKGIPPRPC